MRRFTISDEWDFGRFGNALAKRERLMFSYGAQESECCLLIKVCTKKPLFLVTRELIKIKHVKRV